MYAQVIVLTYQSPEIDSYTYEIPEELEAKIKVGQIVSVPFGKRNPTGIIISMLSSHPRKSEDLIFRRKTFLLDQVENDKKKINIKPISSIILEKPILLPYQIKLLIWMSDYYIAPMVNCLEAMLPEIPKKLLSVNSSQFTVKSINQTLVLVPSLNQLPQVLAQFTNAKNHIVYTNELKTSEKFNVWQKIQSGQIDFIFGSRSAIFSPCPNLKKIIIFDEHDGAFKDDRSPYFDTITVAEKISSLTDAKIEIIDSSPHITTFTNHKDYITFPVIVSSSSVILSEAKESNRVRVNSTKQSQNQIATSRPFNENGGTRNDKKNLPQTKIISLANERKLGNYSPISLTLEEIINRAYAKSLSILLFLNKKIESGSIYCKNCKHREFFKSQPDVCPNCQSTDIFFNSTNINSLAKEVKKILPNVQINLIAEKLNQIPATRYQQPEITIATSSVFYRLLSKKYDLVAHLYADSPLNFNDYNSAEEIYSQITNLKKLTKKLLVIQTYNDDLPAIKFAAAGNYKAFYDTELAPRKILNYPPYSILVKISISGKKEIHVEEKAQEIKTLINQQSTIDNLQLTILGPYKSVTKTALSYNIILKIPLINYALALREKALDKIKDLIPRQKDVRIIVEPKNLNQ